MIDKKLLNNSAENIKKRVVEIVTVEDILAVDYGPEVWTVDRLIPKCSIVALTASPANFKTWLTLDIAKSVSNGTPFLDKFSTEKGRVLILDKENQKRHIQKRFKMLGMKGREIDYYVNPDNFQITNEKDFKILLDIVEVRKIKLVIFDSLVRIHSGEENDSRSISLVMGKLREITNHGVTVLVIHHHKKEGEKTNYQNTSNIRGSSDILAGVDATIQIKREGEFISVSQGKLRTDEELKPFRIKIEKSKESISFLYAGEEKSTKPNREELKGDILAIISNGEKSQKEIYEFFSDTDYSKLSVTTVLRSLESEKIIIKRVGASNAFYFRLPGAEPQLFNNAI